MEPNGSPSQQTSEAQSTMPSPATLSVPLNPLVLTLTLDRASQAFLTNLRAKYFPPHRNHLHAHVTLFHAIPAAWIHELDRELTKLCGKAKEWDVGIGEPKKMGRGGVMVMLKEEEAGKDRKGIEKGKGKDQANGGGLPPPAPPPRVVPGSRQYTTQHKVIHPHVASETASSETVWTVQKIHRHLLKYLKKTLKDRQASSSVGREGSGNTDVLTNQDQMGLGTPHVTVLNKAEKEEDVEECFKEVKELFSSMKAGSEDKGEGNGERRGRAIGLEL